MARVKVKKKEATKLVDRTYWQVLRRKPDKHAASWVEAIQLGVFDEVTLPKVFRLSSEYLNRE